MMFARLYLLVIVTNAVLIVRRDVGDYCGPVLADCNEGQICTSANGELRCESGIVATISKKTHGRIHFNGVEAISVLDGYKGWKRVIHTGNFGWDESVSGRLFRVIEHRKTTTVRYTGVDSSFRSVITPSLTPAPSTQSVHSTHAANRSTGTYISSTMTPQPLTKTSTRPSRSNQSPRSTVTSLFRSTNKAPPITSSEPDINLHSGCRYDLAISFSFLVGALLGMVGTLLYCRKRLKTMRVVAPGYRVPSLSTMINSTIIDDELL